MIDNKIIKIAEWISELILPSKLLKYMLYAVIIASILSLFIGYWIIIWTIAAVEVTHIVTEFLYAKQIEQEVLEKDDDPLDISY